jgi:hypothetical protein
MARGLSYGASYNFSKYLEAVAYLNANDARPSNAISSADRQHRVILNGIYELPFGRGKPFLAGKRILRDVIGGWQTQWVVTLQTGAPLAFTAGSAVRLNKPSNNPKTVDRWFDISQFAPQAPFTLNTLSIQLNDERVPGINKWDLTALKKIRISERMEFRLQTEFYNAFNKALFDIPNTTVTSPNFGRITAVVIPPRQLQVSGRLTW